jgi:CBS domain-containing protein
MTTKPAVIKQSESVAKAMRMLVDNRLLGLPVVDGDGRYLGIEPRRFCRRLVSLSHATLASSSICA